MSNPTHWRVTRMANACILLEIGDAVILTDPWFQDSQHFSEATKVRPADLPKLTAILGGHWAADHWDIGALDTYPHKAETQVFTSDKRMAAKARRFGFSDAAVLPWEESRDITPMVTVQAIPDHRILGRVTSNYAITTPSLRVFVGTEVLDTDVVGEYADRNEPFDVVFGPVNGVHLVGKQLVVTASQMVHLAKRLGASTFIPFHYAHKPILGMVSPTSGVQDVPLHRDEDGMDVVVLDLDASYGAPKTCN